jgi:hypothetical protein
MLPVKRNGGGLGPGGAGMEAAAVHGILTAGGGLARIMGLVLILVLVLVLALVLGILLLALVALDT